jgi:hypothetical protein
MHQEKSFNVEVEIMSNSESTCYGDFIRNRLSLHENSEFSTFTTKDKVFLMMFKDRGEVDDDNDDCIEAICTWPGEFGRWISKKKVAARRSGYEAGQDNVESSVENFIKDRCYYSCNYNDRTVGTVNRSKDTSHFNHSLSLSYELVLFYFLIFHPLISNGLVLGAIISRQVRMMSFDLMIPALYFILLNRCFCEESNFYFKGYYSSRKSSSFDS